MKTNTLSKRKIRRIINCFASGLTAIDTAHKLKLHRNTVNKYYRLMRDAIVNNQESILRNHVETLDFKFPLIWHKNKGLSLNHIPEYDDILFFAIAIDSRNKTYLKAVKDTEGEAITAQVLAQSQPTTASSNTSANQIEAEKEAEQVQVAVPETVRRFYLYAKEKLTKFYGVKPQYTYLYLKELEFRFNNQDQNISSLCWKVISQYERKLNNEKEMAKKAKTAKKSL